eukprot:4367622-Amphidinium_carterae.1
MQANICSQVGLNMLLGLCWTWVSGCSCGSLVVQLRYLLLTIVCCLDIASDACCNVNRWLMEFYDVGMIIAYDPVPDPQEQ